MENKVPETVEFNIISSEKLPNLKLSKKNVVRIIDALNLYIKYIETRDYDKTINQCAKEYELEETKKLFKYIQETSNYNYENEVKKCTKKPKKKHDVGQEIFGWL